MPVSRKTSLFFALRVLRMQQSHPDAAELTQHTPVPPPFGCDACIREKTRPEFEGNLVYFLVAQAVGNAFLPTVSFRVGTKPCPPTRLFYAHKSKTLS